ncbi:hypothetical protein HHK36_031122 [Tetracentron sinense]|uniref:Uncharacterized protein n=1 Tax=Tetracentron sinense TaxID=13715 RepID=A0A835CYY6_TETSI|nr:hypothetical protein HHK36_031122 [Tetracentron sinense]
MVSPKRLIAMARKWGKLAAMGRRRISLPKATNGLADRGHFIVYTTDNKRFLVPLPYLSSKIFRELFKMSEDEFGLPSDGPITLPCDAVFLEYEDVFQNSKDLEKALLVSLASASLMQRAVTSAVAVFALC